jgi:hypothetical protein
MMICEIKIEAGTTITTITCNSLEETVQIMSEWFSKANDCCIEESTAVLSGVTSLISNMPESAEFTAWEVEDHDNNNEVIKCIIKKISN